MNATHRLPQDQVRGAPGFSVRAWWSAFAGGITAGALDILWACGMAEASGGSWVRILQAVASGVLGASAFQGGLPTAWFGLLCHFLIALAAAGVYLLAYARWPWLRARFLPGAVGFGVMVYAVMHGVVLPLSAAPFTLSHAPVQVAQGLAVHVLLVGLPIAWCVRWIGFPAARGQAGAHAEPESRQAAGPHDS